MKTFLWKVRLRKLRIFLQKVFKTNPICKEIELKCLTCPVSVFQNRIHLSAVPPPEARSPWWWGDHAMALTAAKCSVKVWTGWVMLEFQTKSLLSLPPEARYWLSGDHLRPHTSCLCPTSRRSEKNSKYNWVMNGSYFQ